MGFEFTAEDGYVDILGDPSWAGPAGYNGWTVMEDDGIIESNPETGPMAVIRFRVFDAANRYTFAQQLLGTWTGTPATGILYVGPYRYPPSPNLLCTSITEIRAFGKPWPMRVTDFVTGAVVWPTVWLFGESALVTAVFTRPPWQAMTSGGYFSLTFQASGEQAAVPETALQFADGTPYNQRMTILVPQQQITVTRFRMPFIPDLFAMPLLTCINAGPFSIGWYTYATGTLLFAGLNSEVESDPLGNITYQCQYIFVYRQIPWGYGFHPDGVSGWVQVYDWAGTPPFAPADFAALP